MRVAHIPGSNESSSCNFTSRERRDDLPKSISLIIGLLVDYFTLYTLLGKVDFKKQTRS